MLIDTHCHLDAASFGHDRAAVIARAKANGLKAIVIPAVARHSFEQVKALAATEEFLFYAIGIHPLFVSGASTEDLAVLDNFIAANINDPKLVAIGEIGLDFYLPELKTVQYRQRQEFFYNQQLKLAQKYKLPVLLHVRKSQDTLLKYLRRTPQVSGIAHAFNGSWQQAEQFLDLGFALGFGGAFTFTRAKQIRRLAVQLPLSALVLETDAPDMAPEWLVSSHGKELARNEPAEVLQIANLLAQLRAIDTDLLLANCAANAFRVLPRLKLAMAK